MGCASHIQSDRYFFLTIQLIGYPKKKAPVKKVKVEKRPKDIKR